MTKKFEIEVTENGVREVYVGDLESINEWLRTPELLNFCANGDVVDVVRDTLLGRIDSDSDWRPVEGCHLSAGVIRMKLRDAIDESPDFRFPSEMLRFADNS